MYIRVTAAHAPVLMIANAVPGGGSGISIGNHRSMHTPQGLTDIGTMTFHCAGSGGKDRAWQRNTICDTERRVDIS